MKTRVVNIKDRYDVYIGRPGKGEPGPFGNPFRIGPDGNRDQVLAKYREWFLKKVENDKAFRDKVFGLRGKVLGCFCKPQDCHGDIIAEWIDDWIQLEGVEEDKKPLQMLEYDGKIYVQKSML
jgi:hypothetical protein